MNKTNERADAFAEAAATLDVVGENMDAIMLYKRAEQLYNRIGRAERAGQMRQYAAECAVRNSVASITEPGEPTSY